MSISRFLRGSTSGLSGKDYDQTFSVYRLWAGIGAAHGLVSKDQLREDILANIRETSLNPSSGKLIHDGIHISLRFITDAELDPALSTYTVGLRDELYFTSLREFFTGNMDLTSRVISGSELYNNQLNEFYTNVNLLAHWVNLGYVKLEDVRDHILQSLIFKSTVYAHQLNSLIILLKISGAAFAAYVHPSVMDRCCHALKSNNLRGMGVATGLAEVRTADSDEG